MNLVIRITFLVFLTFSSVSKLIAQASDLSINSKFVQEYEETGYALPPGGLANFYKFLMDELKYPETAKQDSIEGTVLVRFTVTKKGEIKKIKVIRGVREDVDLEAKRVIEAMPNWESARNGTGVNLVFPVTFKME